MSRSLPLERGDWVGTVTSVTETLSRRPFTARSVWVLSNPGENGHILNVVNSVLSVVSYLFFTLPFMREFTSSFTSSSNDKSLPVWFIFRGTRNSSGRGVRCRLLTCGPRRRDVSLTFECRLRIKKREDK